MELIRVVVKPESIEVPPDGLFHKGPHRKVVAIDRLVVVIDGAQELGRGGVLIDWCHR